MSSHALAQRSLAATPDPVRPAGLDLACYVTPSPDAVPAAPRPRLPEGTRERSWPWSRSRARKTHWPSSVTRSRRRAGGARARDGRPPPPQPDGALVVDRARRRVWLEGAEIRLTYQEFELLAFLSANPAQVFSRADLLARVWPDCPPANTRTVDVHVSRLRRKLGPAYGQCLATEYRVGYRFEPACARVRAGQETGGCGSAGTSCLTR